MVKKMKEKHLKEFIKNSFTSLNKHISNLFQESQINIIIFI
jgi:hypothetical protein